MEDTKARGVSYNLPLSESSVTKARLEGGVSLCLRFSGLVYTPELGWRKEAYIAQTREVSTLKCHSRWRNCPATPTQLHLHER